MDKYTATEIAYRNGYEQGYKDGRENPTMRIYKLVLDPETMVAELDIAINDNMRQTIPIGWCYKDIVKQTEDPARDTIKEFVEYLKKHSCFYDLDNYCSFSAVDVDNLDELAEEFLK